MTATSSKNPNRKQKEARRTRRQPREAQNPYLLVPDDPYDPVRKRFGRSRTLNRLLELPVDDPQHPTDG
jgi:hypothetical protein